MSADDGVRADKDQQDPLTLAAVSGVLGFVAFVACSIPARRALRLDPTIALRSE